jgi:dTDP-glucose 4,6-dehydratase
MTKNVVVTGGAGFIAHHVIEYLLDNTDWNIVCLDRIDTAGNLNRLSDILKVRFKSDAKRVRFVYHDLRAEINQSVSNMIGPVDIILHLAAASHVTRSILNPMEFVESNIIGTVNLLNYARTQDALERFVYFSTDEVFGPAVDGTPFTEYDRYNATNPYSASKAAGEEMCVAYHNTYKLPIYITHTMNVYGERQAPEKYVPMSIKKLLNGETLKIHYSKTTARYGSRNYLHAKDVASALMHILNLTDIPEPKNHRGGRCPKFNISAGKEYSNYVIATILADALKVELKYENYDPNIDRPGHDFSYAISGDYLRSLGWKPTISVEQRMPQVALWYRDNPQWLE